MSLIKHDCARICYTRVRKDVLHMSKPISNHFELKDVCRNAGLWYVGSFMLEYIKMKEMWSNPDTKSAFIQYIYNEYSGIDDDISGTTTRVNAMIRIIESRKVEDALHLVLAADDRKLGCAESKENAKVTLDMLSSGKLLY